MACNAIVGSRLAGSCFRGTAHATITLRCDSGGEVVAGQTVEVACTLFTDEQVTLAGTQIDLPCSLPGKPGSSGTITVTNFFVNTGRADFVFSPTFTGELVPGFGLITASVCIAAGSPAPAFPPGSATLPAGTTAYLATYVYEVSGCAGGEFNVEFENFSDPPHPARDRTKVVTRVGEQFVLLPFDVVVGTLTVKNTGGSISIVASDPPNGAIDAAQPSYLDGSNPTGWRSVKLTFDCALKTLGPDDFSVSQEGGEGPAPTVADAAEVDAQTVMVTLSAPIEPGAWTSIVHDASGTQTRIGFLPGDVNGDGTSGLLDTFTLIDFLNGAANPLPVWSTDIDRSGEANARDILREIDLLNGAEGFEVWNGRSLP